MKHVEDITFIFYLRVAVSLLSCRSCVAVLHSQVARWVAAGLHHCWITCGVTHTSMLFDSLFFLLIHLK